MTLKIKAFISLIVMSISAALSAQTYTGKVTDAKSGEALAFVSIAIPGKSVGTIAQLDGNFTIEIPASHLNDTLRFSIIGYAAKLVSVKSFIAQTNIQLEPDAKELAELVIRPRNMKEVQLGNDFNSPNIIAGFTTDDLGSELGTVMKVKSNKTYYLKSCGFNFAQINYDSIIFRVNIYKLESGLPGELLHQLPIYVTAYRNQRNISVDLKQYGITVNHDFVLSLEWLQDLPDKTKGVMFCAGFFGNKIVYRQVAQSAWEDFPIGIGMWCEAEYEK